MRIYTKAGDLAFSTMRFPDGQPHFRLETYVREFDDVTVESRILSPSDLFEVGMAVDVLRQQGYTNISLNVLYLMAARMDRAINSFQPFTLQLVARFLNSLGLAKVRILDVHSQVALNLIRGSKNVLPKAIYTQIANTLDGDFYVCSPDKGAVERVTNITGMEPEVQGTKKRDVTTGSLSGVTFGSVKNIRGANILIVDDICDGGGTFVGLAEKLKEAGAKDLYLYVTHGIFSRGTEPLLKAGFKKIFTTNSFRDDHSGLSGVVTIPFRFKED